MLRPLAGETDATVQPVEVPPIVTSLVASPLTGSSNVAVKISEDAFVGDAVAAVTATVGAVVSVAITVSE